MLQASVLGDRVARAGATIVMEMSARRSQRSFSATAASSTDAAISTLIYPGNGSRDEGPGTPRAC